MSNTALITVDDISEQELMELTGQDGATQSGGNFLPQLKINTDADDADGNTLPVGTFTVTDTTGRRVYAKEAIFRPFVNVFQYQVYDKETNTFPNRTILFRKWDEEKYDEKGGFACGKTEGKKNKERLTEAQKEAEKVIKAYRVLYGVVTLKGVDQKGNKAEIVNLPCHMRLRGTNFLPIGKVFDKLSKMKRNMIHYEFKFKLTREKSGSNTYYILDPQWIDTPLPFGQVEYDTLKEFSRIIGEINNSVVEKWKAARATDVKSTQVEGEFKLVSELNDDLNDPLPEDMVA